MAARKPSSIGGTNRIAVIIATVAPPCHRCDRAWMPGYSETMGQHTDRPLVTGSLISSVLIMFSTTCRIIVFACVLERAADLPMRSSAQTIHLFDSGRLGQSQGLDADTAWQL